MGARDEAAIAARLRSIFGTAVLLVIAVAAAAGVYVGTYAGERSPGHRATATTGWTATTVREQERASLPSDPVSARARGFTTASPGASIPLLLLAGVIAFFAGLTRMGFAAGLAWFVGVILLFFFAWPLGLIALAAITIYGVGGFFVPLFRGSMRGPAPR